MGFLLSRPISTCAAMASLLLTAPMDSVFASDGACSTYSSAQDELMAGAILSTQSKLSVSSDKQYAVLQAGKLVEGDPDPEQPVCYLWFVKKSGGSRSIAANREMTVGAESSKDHPQCIYDKSCRYVAFPLTDRSVTSDDLKLSSLICENRRATLSLNDVKQAVGTQLQFKLPCEADRNSPDCVKLIAANDPLKNCREAALAARTTKDKSASGRYPASLPASTSRP